MEFQNHSNKLSLGDLRMNHFLNGGLSMGRVSYWTGLIHEFRTGTMMNIIVSVAASNRPPAGSTYRAMYINAEMELNPTVLFLVDILSKRPEAEPQLEGEEPVEYVRRIFTSWGWKLSITCARQLTAGSLDGIIRSADSGGELRLLCLDTMEQLQPAGSGSFKNYLTGLDAVIPKYCHTAVARQLGQHASWLRRTLNDQYMFIRVAARTGYVPKITEGCIPEHMIVHGVMRGVISGSEPGRQDPYVMYHHANDKFEKGYVNMNIARTAWSNHLKKDWMSTNTGTDAEE